MKKFITQGKVTNNSRQGRPRITNSRDDLNVIIKSKRNRRLTAPEITAQINESCNKPISLSTVKRRLLDAGFKGVV